MSGGACLVTLGESLGRLESPGTGPLRHARSLRLGVSGAESNVAIGVRRLGGAAVWAGRVGADEFGELIRMTLAGQRVDITHAVVDPGAPTGLMIKERRAGQPMRVSYYRGGSAGSRLAPGDLPEEVISSAGVLHVTGITLALSESARAAVSAAVAAARAAAVPVSLDLNYRAALWEPRDAAACLGPLLELADIVFATEEEARLLVAGGSASEMAAELAARGPREVLVKRGRHGAVAHCEGTVLEAAACPARLMDPVGAGDAFAAGYLADRLAGRPLAERLVTAAAAGACAVSVAGDWEGLPSREDLAAARATGDQVRR